MREKPQEQSNLSDSSDLFLFHGKPLRFGENDSDRKQYNIISPNVK